MKAHSNIPSRFRAGLKALLALCCVALLSSPPAEAVSMQQATQQRADQQQVNQQQGDENGRTMSDRALRGVPAPVEAVTRSLPDVQEGCDQDEGCSERSRGVADVVIPGDLGVARILQNGLASFQVQEGAPRNSVHVAETGDVGIGTKMPAGRLHVVAKPGEDATRDIFVLDGNGNLELGGVLIEASSMLLKENFTPVDAQAVLEILAALPISTWNYKTDDAAIRHMGPMAQDFYAAFGLGADEAHLAPLDGNGVVLVAVQAYLQRVQAQAAHIATLEQQNAELRRRLQALETLVQKRDE